MDWQGQKVVEQLMQILLLCFAVVAFVAGYVLGSFQMMMLVYAGGVVFTCLLTVPNWSFFNRHPLKWLEPSEAEKHPKPEHVSSSSKKKNSKNCSSLTALITGFSSSKSSSSSSNSSKSSMNDWFAFLRETLLCFFGSKRGSACTTPNSPVLYLQG
ncbi:hypothetical protein Leryth_008097 [Lithospermum erythrorhizon]|nr:hypothetical protein Leryth_008097 [Lithospermum erythrorhizon]